MSEPVPVGPSTSPVASWNHWYVTLDGPAATENAAVAPAMATTGSG
jgi:hypothetical protein